MQRSIYQRLGPVVFASSLVSLGAVTAWIVGDFNGRIGSGFVAAFVVVWLSGVALLSLEKLDHKRPTSTNTDRQ